MTAKKYQDEEKNYEIQVLKDLHTSLKSIDGKVEEILEELQEHLPDLSDSGSGWDVRDIYDHDPYEMY